MIIIFVLSKVPSLNNKSISSQSRKKAKLPVISIFNIIQEIRVNAALIGTKTRVTAMAAGLGDKNYHYLIFFLDNSVESTVKLLKLTKEFSKAA